MEECAELERVLTGGENNIKVELDDEFEPRLNDLKEAIEKNRDEEKFVSKYLKFQRCLVGCMDQINRLL